jgi:hypothetical protein
MREKSLNGLIDELKRCEQLGIPNLVRHVITVQVTLLVIKIDIYICRYYTPELPLAGSVT